jgi:hypothetical protein
MAPSDSAGCTQQPIQAKDILTCNSIPLNTHSVFRRLGHRRCPWPEDMQAIKFRNCVPRSAYDDSRRIIMIRVVSSYFGESSRFARQLILKWMSVSTDGIAAACTRSRRTGLNRSTRLETSRVLPNRGNWQYGKFGVRARLRSNSESMHHRSESEQNISCTGVREFSSHNNGSRKGEPRIGAPTHSLASKATGSKDGRNVHDQAWWRGMRNFRFPRSAASTSISAKAT